MKKCNCIITLVLGLFVFGVSISTAVQKTDLPLRYKKWLNEEVVYIITSVEREVFLKLKNDRERDIFIEAFWKQRDPTKGTPENETKTEHYRRISFANHNFGRSSPLPGWRTDRGRVYIILGEPNDIQRFDGKAQVYPAEIWFYQDMTKYGLPPGFNLLLYKRKGIGKYELYSPLNDGPMALLSSFIGNPMDYTTAYAKLRDVDPNLAQVSMSLIPGDQDATYGTPTLSSDLLIQRVETTPERMVNKKYASKFLEYKDIIEVEYSVNYINCDALIKITRHPSGYFFIHFALEPDQLSVNQYKDKYFTTIKLNGTVSAPDGTIIYQYERDISLEFNPAQIKTVFNTPVSIRDLFPIIPGQFKLSLLMKNEVSKEFTSIAQEIVIPAEGSGIWMTSPILGYKVNKRAPDSSRIYPFQLGNSQLFTQAGRIFLKKDSLAIAFQIHGMNRDQKEKGEIVYRFQRDEEKFFSISRKVSEYASPMEIVESISLNDFPPAHYWIDISLRLDDQVLVTRRDEFDVTFAEDMARPWFYNKVLPGTASPVYLYAVGTQYANYGQQEEARARLEEAHRTAPQSKDVALSLSRVYQKMKEYARIESLLLPFVEQSQNSDYETFTILAESYKKQGRWAKAIDVFNKAVDQFGVSTFLLNNIGSCYLNLADKERARQAWKKSLELNPNQLEIKKELEALKGKKLN